MPKQKNKQRGITLIALVVSIIVLIILAGVSIAMLVGENGIITQAQKAKKETEIKSDEEKIRLAINVAQIENNGNSKIKKDDLEIALSENGTKSIVVDNEDGTRNIIFLDSKKIYKLNSDGSIEDTNSDFDSIYVVPDSQDDPRNEGVIGIGTDGQPVDMDLWEYTLLEDGTYGLNDEASLLENDEGTSSYNNENLIDGKIQGTIPQYIKGDINDDFIPITHIDFAFINTDLIEAPVIPSTVICMRATFNRCENLIKMPNIPNSVKYMYGTFAGCTNLVETTDIPDSVIDLGGTFRKCSSLIVAPKISKNATNMALTFSYCTALIEAPDIPNSVTDMYQAFRGCTSLQSVSVISNNVINMYGTFSGCVQLKKAPTIPKTVIDLRHTFNGCTNLQGILEINASVTGAMFNTEIDYKNCLSGASTTEGIYLKVIGDCLVLSQIVSTKSANSNIGM